VFKKFFFVLSLSALGKLVCANDVQIKENLIAGPVSVELQDDVIQPQISATNFVSFSVIKSVEFEKIVELVTGESKVALEDFIKRTEQALFSNVEFALVAKQYKELFDELKDVKKGLPKVTLVFSVDGEYGVDLLVSNQLNTEALKNALSEDQITKFGEDFAAMAISIEDVAKSVLVGLENSSLQAELKEKSGNKLFRIDLILT